jgi:Transposase and inactivated derivatives
VIDYETYVRIRNYFEQDGLTVSQIAEILAMDCRTVEKWANIKRYQPRKFSLRKSKLDPFKEHIVRMLEKHPYSAVQVFQRVKEYGYEGGDTIVEDYVRKVRPPKTPAFLKLVFAPGECAQVDWGSYGTVRVGATTRRLSFFVMALCYSRMMYVEFTVLQTMEHFLGCHQNAFQFFGSVPQKVMVDNLKSAVLKRIVGRAPVFNPRYLDFAKHYGFSIVPCNVGKGNEKGIVENAVGYVKKNLLSGLDISDFCIMEPVAQQWLATVANVRNHRETGKKPVDLFCDEKSSLQPLPVAPYDIGVVKPMRASRQFRVTIDTNRYSVPAQLAGVSLTVKIYPDRICIYHDNNLVAWHVRSYDRLKDFEHPDHPKVLLEQRKKARDQKIFMRFLSLSDKSEAYYRQLEQRRMNPFHHIRQIVALSEIHGKEKLARAMEDAFTFAAFSCEYIANLLEQRSRPFKEPGALHLTRSSDLLDLTLDHPDLSIYNLKGDDHE